MCIRDRPWLLTAIGRPGLIARPAFCCGTCPPRGHSIASVARSAGLHPLRISLYARAAGSRDTFIVSVSHQYNTILDRGAVALGRLRLADWALGTGLCQLESYVRNLPLALRFLETVSGRRDARGLGGATRHHPQHQYTARSGEQTSRFSLLRRARRSQMVGV